MNDNRHLDVINTANNQENRPQNSNLYNVSRTSGRVSSAKNNRTSKNTDNYPIVSIRAPVRDYINEKLSIDDENCDRNDSPTIGFDSQNDFYTNQKPSQRNSFGNPTKSPLYRIQSAFENTQNSPVPKNMTSDQSKHSPDRSSRNRQTCEKNEYNEIFSHFNSKKTATNIRASSRDKNRSVSRDRNDSREAAWEKCGINIKTKIDDIRKNQESKEISIMNIDDYFTNRRLQRQNNPAHISDKDKEEALERKFIFEKR